MVNKMFNESWKNIYVIGHGLHVLEQIRHSHFVVLQRVYDNLVIPKVLKIKNTS